MRGSEREKRGKLETEREREREIVFSFCYLLFFIISPTTTNNNTENRERERELGKWNIYAHNKVDLLTHHTRKQGILITNCLPPAVVDSRTAATAAFDQKLHNSTLMSLSYKRLMQIDEVNLSRNTAIYITIYIK